MTNLTNIGDLPAKGFAPGQITHLLPLTLHPLASKGVVKRHPLQPHTLKACPFCKMQPPTDLSDTLYPSGIYWRETDGVRHYVGHKERIESDQACWTVECAQSSGGCGASLTGDSAQEAMDLWNRRDAENKDASEAVNQVMEQAQVFASTWSLVGGRFDSGSCMEDAESAKEELRTMVESLAWFAADAQDAFARGMACRPASVQQADQSDELTKLKGEAKVLRDLLGLTLGVVDSAEAENSEEAEMLMQLYNKINAALRGAA